MANENNQNQQNQSSELAVRREKLAALVEAGKIKITSDIEALRASIETISAIDF